MTEQDIIALLYDALSAPHGIEVLVVSGSARSARQRLYTVRKKQQDPDLLVLQFRASPESPDGAIWITKGGALYEAEPE